MRHLRVFCQGLSHRLQQNGLRVLIGFLRLFFLVRFFGVYWLFVCLLVCLFACLFVSFVCLLACLFVCLLACLFVCLFPLVCRLFMLMFCGAALHLVYAFGRGWPGLLSSSAAFGGVWRLTQTTGAWYMMGLKQQTRNKNHCERSSEVAMSHDDWWHLFVPMGWKLKLQLSEEVSPISKCASCQWKTQTSQDKPTKSKPKPQAKANK